jgi:hypothetical protein
MSAPSRRPEIRRRRTRKEKILKWRRQLAMSTSENDKKRINGKLQRLSLASPGQPLTQA